MAITSAGALTGGVVTKAGTPQPDGTEVSHIEVEFTAAANDTHALKICCDAAGFADVSAVDIDYKTGALAATENDEAQKINIDESLSTGGRISAQVVVATDFGSAEIDALEVGANVHPLRQISGVFADLDSILNVAADVLTALSSGGAGNITCFAADDDSMTFGDTVIFEELEFLMDTPASHDIQATWEYSTGEGTWATFSPTDGTDGMTQTGVVAWIASIDIPGWATGLNTEYLIRVTRTRNSLPTAPIIDQIERETGSDYFWNASGNVECNDIQHTGTHLGFYGTTKATKPSITTANAAQLLAALVALGLVSDDT